MPTVYIFRGKSATGKTTLSNILSHHLNIAVFRKDDVFDPLSIFIENHTLNSQASYDVLSNMINTSIKNGIDVIVDIALPHKPNYELFLSKIDFLYSDVFTPFHHHRRFGVSARHHTRALRN